MLQGSPGKSLAFRAETPHSNVTCSNSKCSMCDSLVCHENGKINKNDIDLFALDFEISHL